MFESIQSQNDGAQPQRHEHWHASTFTKPKLSWLSAHEKQEYQRKCDLFWSLWCSVSLRNLFSSEHRQHRDSPRLDCPSLQLLQLFTLSSGAADIASSGLSSFSFRSNKKHAKSTSLAKRAKKMNPKDSVSVHVVHVGWLKKSDVTMFTHLGTSCSRTPRIACAVAKSSKLGNVRHRTGRLMKILLRDFIPCLPSCFASSTKYRSVTTSIMHRTFYTLVSFKLQEHQELRFAFAACFKASCASCKASVVSCTSLSAKLVETKNWNDIQ